MGSFCLSLSLCFSFSNPFLIFSLPFLCVEVLQNPQTFRRVHTFYLTLALFVGTHRSESRCTQSPSWTVSDPYRKTKKDVKIINSCKKRRFNISSFWALICVMESFHKYNLLSALSNFTAIRREKNTKN